MTKPSLRQQQGEIRRQQILESAVNLFATQGVAGTTTKKIAQEVGVAEALIFHYFPTKRDLLEAVLNSHHSYINELRLLLNEARDESPQILLRRIAEGWLRTLRREKALTTVIIAEAGIDPIVDEILHNVVKDGITRLAAYLEEKRKAGFVSPELNVTMVAHTFLSSIIVFFILNRSLSAADWTARSQEFVESLMNNWSILTL